MGIFKTTESKYEALAVTWNLLRVTAVSLQSKFLFLGSALHINRVTVVTHHGIHWWWRNI